MHYQMFFYMKWIFSNVIVILLRIQNVYCTNYVHFLNKIDSRFSDIYLHNVYIIRFLNAA